MQEMPTTKYICPICGLLTTDEQITMRNKSFIQYVVCPNCDKVIAIDEWIETDE
jgi:ssDNA-binding Zn-finger/Zn-ribbon topoisomerase 1